MPALLTQCLLILLLPAVAAANEFLSETYLCGVCREIQYLHKALSSRHTPRENVFGVVSSHVCVVCCVVCCVRKLCVVALCVVLLCAVSRFIVLCVVVLCVVCVLYHVVICVVLLCAVSCCIVCCVIVYCIML